MIARVIIEKGPGRSFEYFVPEGLRSRVRPGVRVRVLFGRREARGTVVEVAESSDRTDLREILEVAGEGASLSERLLALADWIGRYYNVPGPAVFRTMVPAPVRARDLRGERLRRHVEIPEGDGLARSPSTPGRRNALEKLRRHGGGWMTEVLRAAGVTPAMLKNLEKEGFVRVVDRPWKTDPLANRVVIPTEPLALMPEQKVALRAVCEACAARDPRPILLHGATGSGKTEVYLQAIAEVLAAGGGAIVLVPEIALTPQTLFRFAGRFGDKVALLHSALGAGERQSAWERLRKGRARVVVGPRSAVFAPVTNLGLIVVDEEHEPSYKQEESPRYNARDVAVMRARLESCSVVLGSATPCLESWRNALRGKYRRVRMPRRVDDRKPPAVRVVDMRRETARTGRIQVFSKGLIEAVESRLAVGEQVMLFLNRRGFAASMICAGCGYVARCAHCSVSLTYHRDDERLVCHICGETAPAPTQCPGCGAEGLRYTGIGTQRVEKITRTFFPRARVQRLDADVTRKRRSHEEILAEFRARRIDILVGTQMIAKGLDFPNVTLVGVLMADMSMHQPDFRAGERTFQLLAQVAGRSGRGDTPGEVIVQTYTPHHPALDAVLQDDFEGFAAGELAEREAFGYPPFRRLICITVSATDEATARRGAEGLREALARGLPEGAELSAVEPAPLARARGRFRFQMLLLAEDPRPVVRRFNALPDSIRSPRGTGVTFDVDALHIG